MAWIQQPCFLCRGKGKLEIGRNIGEQKPVYQPCPVCRAKGFITIYKITWGKPHKRFTL